MFIPLGGLMTWDFATDLSFCGEALDLLLGTLSFDNSLGLDGSCPFLLFTIIPFIWDLRAWFTLDWGLLMVA